MRIGYLPEAEDAAGKLKRRGYDVDEYDDKIPFDVLLYSGQMSSDPVTGLDPAAPLFMLNTRKLDDEELDRQLHNRTYSKLFE